MVINPCESKSEEKEKNVIPQGVPQENPQLISITAFINSIKNSNMTLTDFLASAQKSVKSMNLTSAGEIKIFVDFFFESTSCLQECIQRF
ncbi:hypothetical protein CHH80_16875 [Bacillus sp. 7504-2]|nr:hypothetical protein CHH80_16875 [Bacillus sp. 7504-2]